MTDAKPFSHTLAAWIATFFKVGRIPFAPGTMGTLAAIPLCYAVQSINAGWAWLSLLLAAALVTLVGTWATHVHCQVIRMSDPGEVVVDEVAGYLLTMAMAPLGWGWLWAGFFVFRIFDILKPWPVSWLDREVKGGWGVMVDDLGAGVYAGACLFVAAKVL